MTGSADGSDPVTALSHQALVDAIADHAIFRLDALGFITSWSEGCRRLTGYAAEDVLGRNHSILFTQDERSGGIPEALLAEALQRRRAVHEGWKLRADASRFWACASLHPIRDRNGRATGYAVIMRDDTAAMSALQSLRESEHQFRTLVEGVFDYAIYMLDPSGIITSWNSGAQRLKGYSAQEIIGHHFSRFYTREDRLAGLPAHVIETARREGRYEAEGWRERKDGTRFWALVAVDAIRREDGSLLGFAKVTRDITERRAAQEALRESERQFRLFVDNVVDYALIMLDPNGVIVSWNAGARRIKGYASEEILGQHISRFYTEQERNAGVPARALHTAVHEGRFETEGWRVRRDGSLYWANSIIDPIRDETGQLIGFAKITRDITERRDSQAALQAIRAQRDHAQRMEAMGQLTGGVAHDFNNLLMIVRGHVQALKRLLAGDERATRSAEAIETAIRRGESLTRQLLTFSRRQSLNPAVIDLRTQIGSFRAMLASSLGGAVALETELSDEIWPVRIDASEFELAMLNLALNARDAMPQGGLVTIRVENRTFPSQASPLALSGDFVAVSVVDSGSGIAPDILPRVFDPFFTTKQSDRGSGLGLSQVHGFAHQSGGTVAIDSTLGLGTKVTIYLPRTIEQPAAEDAHPADALKGAGSILLVEDNPEVAEVTAGMLELLGYRTRVANSAEAALEWLKTDSFDAVVSDIVMAGAMDGLGLAKAIRAEHPELPVLLVTGYSNVVAAREQDFLVLRKPYEMADLGRSLSRVIAKSAPNDGANIIKLPRRPSA